MDVQATSNGNEMERPTFQPMDPERREWLGEALTSLTINVPQEMMKAIDVLKTRAETEVDAVNHERALDFLLELVDNLDFANGKYFHKIGGFQILSPNLNSHFPCLRMKTADLFAELVQNNPYCQKAAGEFGLIPQLLDLLENDPEPEVRIKALYGLSCLIRHNNAALDEFMAQDGFSYLLRAMQSNIDKLRIKSSFLISCLCEQKPEIKDTLTRMGFVDQLVALIQMDHDSTHEHLLSALNCLVTNHTESINECRNPQLHLKETLYARFYLLQGREECLEELEYCKQLLNTVFNTVFNNSQNKSIIPR
uniref:Nucleotide exchange factor Fes1 domain-containing protein n=1 Tax=Strigamia maritima TaxID=126957 RepID=T1JDV9_STRMM